MRVWIDLVNSPHVIFFLPIIKRLEQSGIEVEITYRDFAQTAQLVKQHTLGATLIDGHGGKNKLAKVFNLIARTVSLVRYAKSKKFDVALSHNSYFQLAAAKLLGIPSLTSMDFEGQPANHIAFRLASIVSLPTAFPQQSALKFGAKQIRRYSGLKEDICLADFQKTANYSSVIQEAFALSENEMRKPLVVVRPPPTLALYHNNDESFFDLCLTRLCEIDVTVLVLPRVESQKVALESKFPNFKFSQRVLDGLQLVNCADAVISGGGSMNREAACLNTPAYTLFSGELPNVDKQLEKQGLLIALNNELQIKNLDIKKKETVRNAANQQAISDFMSHINELKQAG
ncbi:DUF354 domain-containing protein [Pseudoalteromonas spongiae]|uniref:DUF354 domain-containing protein n=1 Tax=Pseudoalteromonas spongiae TaxID=298657 RepID=UPI00026CDA96|nr:DUF354 domain-containing protein [Pseudoalteromonas spongiae]ATC97631.1 hypothetical protein PSPO_a0410 [Pseudoalteromonas spongiae UST010723-006]